MSLLDQKRVQAELFARRVDEMVAVYRTLLTNRVATTPPSESSFAVVMSPPQMLFPLEVNFPKPDVLFGRVVKEVRDMGYGVAWTPRHPFNVEVSWAASLPPRADEVKIEPLTIEPPATAAEPAPASIAFSSFGPSHSFVPLTPVASGGSSSISLSALAPPKTQFSNILSRLK
jgi:hypothetical protein